MFCPDLNKNFTNKVAMFSELKANKKLLKTSKKSSIKTKSNTFNLQEASGEAVKGLPDLEKGYTYAVISNTNYLDSHMDVHADNSMSKTATEQAGKVYYLADHEMKVGSIIATPKNVEMFVKQYNWRDLGKDYDGTTQALIFKIKKDKLMHEQAIKLIEGEESMQNSIRMQYVNLDLAINDGDEDYAEEFKVWNEMYPKLANQEKAMENGYFWVVRELKIINEGSMVLFGSNDATPIENSKEAVEDTSSSESSEDTQKRSIEDMLSEIKY